MVIRSNEKIILNEEKSTNYFFLQEKQKQKKKQITLLENEQGKSITKTSDILKECTNYQKLHTKPKTCEIAQKELLKNITHKTTNEKNEKLTKKVDINEIREAIQSMENRASPGVDGIPIEFYKEFSETIIPNFQKSYNETLFINKKNAKNLEPSKNNSNTKKGNIKLLKYWRPISLLCVDYKILTKILTNRLRHILPQMISEEQNCSITNRTIFNNLFLIRDMITYTKQKNNHLYLLQVDQEKLSIKLTETYTKTQKK